MNTLASIFNLGGPDMIIILVIVLLLFGAKKLPELARGMGQAMREFSKARDDFEREVTRPPAQAPAQPQPLEEPKVVATEDPHKQDQASSSHA